MPTTIENVAGYDLTQLEIKVVEDKREAIFKKKATLTPQAANDELKKEEGEEKSSEEEDDDDDEDEDKPTDADSKEVKDAPAATAPTKPAVDPAAPVVHEGVSCDSCHMDPLVGIRYKCARCALLLPIFPPMFTSNSPEDPNFDLCQACMDKKEHNQTHEFLMIPVSRIQKPVHTDVRCDLCGESPIIGTRYKCME
jgi:hypothetical protein